MSAISPMPSPGGTPGRFHDLGLRAASAAVLVPVALGALSWGGLVWAALLVLLFAGLMREWIGLGRHIVPAARPRFLLAGVVYAAVPAAALLWLRDRPHGLAAVLFLLVVVWMTDIGAYAAGRLLGGPRLAPAISPGKTVSGAIGGLAVGVLAGLLVARTPASILPAAVLSIVSQAGDLAESALKRRIGVKDSGRTIPGHGGLFDRLDGVLAAAPVAAALALLAQGGGLPWQ